MGHLLCHLCPYIFKLFDYLGLCLFINEALHLLFQDVRNGFESFITKQIKNGVFLMNSTAA